MQPSSPRRVKKMTRAVGSSTRASRPCMASRRMSALMPTLRWWRRSPSRPPTSMMAKPVRMHCRIARVKSSATALTKAVISRCGPRQGRHTTHRRHRHVGSRRSRNAQTARCLEPADPSGSWPYREDLRHMEAQLRPAPNAMARPCQSRRAGPSHRHRLQPQTHRQHRRCSGINVDATSGGQAMTAAMIASIRLRTRRRLQLPAHRSHYATPETEKALGNSCTTTSCTHASRRRNIYSTEFRHGQSGLNPIHLNAAFELRLVLSLSMFQKVNHTVHYRTDAFTVMVHC